MTKTKMFLAKVECDEHEDEEIKSIYNFILHNSTRAPEFGPVVSWSLQSSEKEIFARWGLPSAVGFSWCFRNYYRPYSDMTFSSESCSRLEDISLIQCYGFDKTNF